MEGPLVPESIVTCCHETLDCLQEVIRRFSDHHHGVSWVEARRFWQTSSSSSSSSSSSPALKDIVHLYAPVHLESQFEQLYCLLHPCLVERDKETNAAAFCLGHRGMGKGMLLERCLQALRDELTYGSNNSNNPRPMFRVVQVHGVMVPGHDVSVVVKDMLQQLSQAAFQESAELTAPQLGPQPQQREDEEEEGEEEKKSPVRKRPRTKIDRGLRLRHSTFESNLQLLSETLKLARVDQIPILIVLDEVEAFLGGGSSSMSSDNNLHHNNNNNSQGNLLGKAAGRDRQLLLYHLLDRVATQGSNVCLVGLTQHLALRSMLEKRIKSRMEGTSKEIFLGLPSSMDALTNLLLSNVKSRNCSSSSSSSAVLSCNNGRIKFLKILHDQISHLLTAPTTPQNAHQEIFSSTNDNYNNISKTQQQRRVWETLEREYRMGRNIRWFNRVFAFALSLYRTDWMMYRWEQGKPGSSTPTFQARHIMEALVAQGASIQPEQYGDNNNKMTTTNNNSGGQQQQQQQLHNDRQKRNSNLVIVDADNYSDQNSSSIIAVDPRIQALMDLSGPQVALLLAARRILSRDAQWNGETTTPPPLTLARIVQELKSFKAAQQKYSRHLLWVAFTELIETSLLRPAADHCGTGPFQFDHQVQTYSSISEAENIPLHLLVDINRELMVALQNNLLECSTALKEWGRKTNN